MSEIKEMFNIKAAAFDCIAEAYHKGQFDDIKYFIMNAERKIEDIKDGKVQGK